MADDTPAAPQPTSTAVPASPPALEARIQAAIRTWRDDVIAGGPIASATECWNHLEQSLQHLASAIMKEL